MVLAYMILKLNKNILYQFPYLNLLIYTLESPPLIDPLKIILKL